MAICVICPLSFGLLRLLRAQTHPLQRLQGAKKATRDQGPAEDDQTIVLDAHSALNITLFPPLLFVSALYYTDVISTLMVLLNYSAFTKKQIASGSIFENINAVSIGVMAILFRQTNIFWVAIFPAGLAVVDALTRGHVVPASSRAKSAAIILENSWNTGVVHDCPVQSAGPQGIFYPLPTTLALTETG